jgi:SAM-dependent methyltransferase
MRDELLEILCCPECEQYLDLRIHKGDKNLVIEGLFSCSSCKKNFEIFDDIPYFSDDIKHGGVKNQYETYSHWFEEMHDEESIINPTHENAFMSSLRINELEFDNKIVLDAGCGNGRFSYVVSKYSPKLLVSFDISKGLGKAKETILKHNPDANIAFIQGDITHPPFKKEVFDIIYSWGVTHHTPDTKKTVETLSSLVKEKGIFGIYVYVFNPDYQYDKQILGLLAYLRSIFLIRPFRFFCSRLPVSLVKLIFQPIFYIEKFFGFGIFGNHGYPDDPFNKDRYFRVVVDRFKTRYASEHTREEIFKWFFDLNFNDLRVGNPKVSVTGLKSKESNSKKKITIFE